MRQHLNKLPCTKKFCGPINVLKNVSNNATSSLASRTFLKSFLFHTTRHALFGVVDWAPVLVATTSRDR